MNIYNINYSTKVISQIEECCKEKCLNMKFKEFDLLDMSFFENGEFNTILDKGTLN